MTTFTPNDTLMGAFRSMLKCTETLDPIGDDATTPEKPKKHALATTPVIVLPDFLDPTSTPTKRRKKCTADPPLPAPPTADPANRSQRAARSAFIGSLFAGDNWHDTVNKQIFTADIAGRGAYGDVVKLSIPSVGGAISVKKVECPKPNRSASAALVEETRLLDSIEPIIACWLSANALDSSPSFCCYYAAHRGDVTLTGRHLEVNTDHPAMLLFGEFARLGCLDQIFIDMLADNDFGGVFSCIVQVLMAVATMTCYGVSHNDLFLHNVVVDKCGSEPIAYVFPSGKRRVVNTHGRLMALCDFGLAASDDWLDEKDDCDPRVRPETETGCVDMTTYYYELEPASIIEGRPPNGIPSGPEQVLPHTLSYKGLGAHERDITSFLAGALIATESVRIPTRASIAVRRYTKDMLSALDKEAPNTDAEIVSFIESITSRATIGMYCNSSRVFGGEDDAVSAERTYALPTETERAAKRTMLRAELAKGCESGVVIGTANLKAGME